MGFCVCARQQDGEVPSVSVAWLLLALGRLLCLLLAACLLQHDVVGWVRCLCGLPPRLTQLQKETKVRSHAPDGSFGGSGTGTWHGMAWAWDGARIREAWAGTSRHGPGMARCGGG